MTTHSTQHREKCRLSPSEGEGRAGVGRGQMRGGKNAMEARYRALRSLASLVDSHPARGCRLVPYSPQITHLRSQTGPLKVRPSPRTELACLTLSCSEEPRAQNRQHQRQEQRLEFPPRSHVCRYSTRTRHGWLLSDAPVSSEERPGSKHKPGNHQRARQAGKSSGSPARPRIRRLPQLCAPGSLRSRSIGSEPLRG